MLPSLPAQQRGHDGVAGVEPRGEVRDRDADLDGHAVALTRDVHEPELGLDHHVVAGAGGVGARLPVSSYAGVDEVRVQGAEGVVVELVLGEGVGEVVLDEDVALAGEAVEDVYPGRAGEGDADGLLVAVYLREGGTLDVNRP